MILISFKNLRVRLALWGLLLLGLTQITASFVQYGAISTWLEDQINSNLLLIATQVTTVIYDPEEPDQPLDIEDIQLQFGDNSGIATRIFLEEKRFFVRVIDTNQQSILARTTEHDFPVLVSQIDEPIFETVSFNFPEGMEELRQYSVPLSFAPGTILQVGLSLEGVREIERDVSQMLMVLVLLVGILAPLSGWFLANRALIPIRAIARTATEINETDLTRRLNLASAEVELSHLVQTFNAMLERIEGAFQRQRQFTTDAAHELRTPLSIMQTGLEVTLSQTRTVDDYQATLTNMQEEVQRLSQLASSLLMLARADTHEIPLENYRFDLSLMLITIVEQFKSVADNKGITLIHDIQPALLLDGDEDRLIQVMVNLIDNAIKYTPDDGQVCIYAKLIEQQIEVIIEDTGTGIPSEEQAYIFDRFYRTDASRNRAQGGFGLGLAIAKRIIDLHHGTIQIISEPNLGTKFVVLLPV